MLARAALRPLVFRRTLSVAARLRSEAPPLLQGQGSPAGAVPSDLDQSTGLERLELLSKLEGKDPFFMEPIQLDRLATPANPVSVPSLDNYRIIGCSGFPADSHEVLYFRVNQSEKPTRCPECGSAFKLDFQGDPHGGHHH